MLVELRLGKCAELLGEIHRAMIGIGAVASAVLAAALLAGLLPGDGGPGPALGADRSVRERTDQALRSVEALDDALAAALDPARRGAARIVAGDLAPSEPLEDASATTLAAEPLAREVVTALAELASALRARAPASPTPDPPLQGGSLTAIAGQLAATADAGDAFAEMRRRASAVTERLSDALAALDAGQVDEADRLVSEARASHDVLREWDVGLVTLPVWIGTTDAMIGAMEGIVSATIASDRDAAREAAAAFAELEDEAAEADRALRIAMSEGGAAVAAPALGQLADAVAAVRQTRAELRAMREAESR